MPSQQPFDRGAEDFSNIISLEHVNTRIPEQPPATLFYVTGLGLTRDPYLNTGIDNMWVNAGLQQFHLPNGEPQVLRGITGLSVSDLQALGERLDGLVERLKGTRFSYEIQSDRILCTSPWGNRLMCFSNPVGRSLPAITWVQFDVPENTTDRIAAFYRSVLGAPASVTEETSATDATLNGRVARIRVGATQELRFRETTEELPAYDGHHIAIYLADFSGPHDRLHERGLVTEESNRHQYRFTDITDPSTGEVLYQLEHEVRSLSHPLFNRQHTNRNPEIGTRNYGTGPERL